MTNMMKKTLLTGFMALLPLLGFSQSENNVSSPTEGVITYDYLGENGIQQTSIEPQLDAAKYSPQGFPGGSAVKNPLASAGNMTFIPGWGRPPGEGNGNPLQCSCPGNPCG